MLKFDIKALPHFNDSEFSVNTNICFVYGRNGTGKTTLAATIKNYSINNERSCYVFSGFEGILSENRQLEALVLGEKNVEIDKIIAKLVLDRDALVEKKKELTKKLTEPQDGEINLFTELRDAEYAYDKTKEQIKKIETKFASEIKKHSPQIAPPSYNISNFHNETKYATSLSGDKIKELTVLLRSEVKEVKDIHFPLIDFRKILNDVNGLLTKFVVEKKLISRIHNSPERILFAQRGLALHKADDICAFCGNRISKDCILELQGYFSAKDVSIIQNELKEKETLLSDFLSTIKTLSINSNDFYPEYKESALILSNELNNRINIVSEFLNILIEAISRKKSELFTESSLLELDAPDDFSDLTKSFESLRLQNNSNNLQVKQEEAKGLLRYHEIQKDLNNQRYVQLQNELKKNEINKEVALNTFNSEQDKISGQNGLDEQIFEIDNKIEILKKQTRNEKILADKINDKLKRYVSFELVYTEGEFGYGYYLVKDLVTGETRNVSDVSTGERNIIAFLYFLGKLESDSENSCHSRIIIFDDPMNSNDDVMQYIIIEEMQSLTNSISKDDFVLIFTHNKHFYLNVSNGFVHFNNAKGNKYTQNNKGKLATFIHLLSDSKKTTIEYIKNKDDDFKTNYDSLWHELIFLYNCKSANTELLLNPIRRIIETFIKFNSSSYNIFFRDNKDAQKLFNVNSHSVDDLEAELNGLTKVEIIDLVRTCFKNNNALEHFNKHWKYN